MSCEALAALGGVDEPPRLSSAAFTTTGAELVVFFDASTDRAAAATGSYFSCADILSFSGADVSLCYWVDESQINADVSESGLVPDSNVTLLSGVVKRPCEERCDCDRAANSSSVSVAAPDPPLVPIALLDGPTTAAACEGFVVGSSQSTGSAGRDLLYFWTASVVDVNASGNATTVLEAVVDAANLGEGKASLEMTSAQLESMAAGGASRVEIVLVLTNFLGGVSAPSAPFPVSVRTDQRRERFFECFFSCNAKKSVGTDAPPNVEIVGGIVQSTMRNKELSVRADGIATSCDGRAQEDRAVTIIFFLSPNGGLTSTSSDQRYFKLPPYSLDAATEYELAVTAVDVKAGTNATSTVTLTVNRADVVAIIAGGSRVVPLGALELSAADSYDEDDPDGALVFSWSLLGEAFAGEVLELDGLAVGEYVFQLNATSADGRFGSTSATIELVDDDPPAVAVAFDFYRVAATDKVVLYGDAAPSSSGGSWRTSSRFNTTWIVTEGGLEGNEGLEAWARTDVAISGSARDREHDLVLASGALVAGATYAFRLEATLAGRAAIGAASVSFYVARLPSSGKLEVLPAAGFALETTFALATYSWVTEDAPLQYAFKTRVNGSESTLQAATRQSSLENVVLPEGSPNVTVVVVATDALGGEAEAAAGARVSPTALDGVALANLTTSLLDSAFALGNTEVVCQTVVAAAGAADAALTATLIDAVAAIASDIDADESLIEQTASALVSVAANGTGIAAAAASSALDSVGILANISVGITAVAAASLGDALSGVLESELFAAYTSPNASNSSSRRLAESAGDTLGLALDGIARAQLNGAVEGEFASEVKSTKLRMSSQKLSTLGEEATVLEAEDSSVSLDASATGDATFAQFDVNQHAAEPGGSEATTKLVRFGLVQSSGGEDGRRRRRLLKVLDGRGRRLFLDGRGRRLFLDGRRLQGNGSKVSLALGASSVSASNQTGGNATCPPGGGGNVSFACADGSVLSAPCPATGVREATVVSFTCPFTEAGCAFWDGSAWSAPPDCETVVDGGDVTCVCAVVDDALDFSATSNSVLGTYASAFTSLSGRDLVSSPLLYWTVFTMALGCFVVGVIGFFLDRRDAAKKSDNAAKKSDAAIIGCLSLEGLVAESMPGFVEELGHPFAWACRMLWKNHSWCKIVSTHMPANPRPRRCVTLFFSLLMIMFGQAIAFWFAYPVGFCDGAEFQRNCEAKKTLYAE